jgi:hypothetical protein
MRVDPLLGLQESLHSNYTCPMLSESTCILRSEHAQMLPHYTAGRRLGKCNVSNVMYAENRSRLLRIVHSYGVFSES